MIISDDASIHICIGDAYESRMRDDIVDHVCDIKLIIFHLISSYVKENTTILIRFPEKNKELYNIFDTLEYTLMKLTLFIQLFLEMN